VCCDTDFARTRSDCAGTLCFAVDSVGVAKSLNATSSKVGAAMAACHTVSHSLRCYFRYRVHALRGCGQMRERIRTATQRANEARRNALGSAEPRFKVEWLQIARMWEELAREYDQVRTMRVRPIRDPAFLTGS